MFPGHWQLYRRPEAKNLKQAEQDFKVLKNKEMVEKYRWQELSFKKSITWEEKIFRTSSVKSKSLFNKGFTGECQMKYVISQFNHLNYSRS